MCALALAGLSAITLDQGSHSFVRQYFEQEGMLYSPIDDMAGFNAILDRIQRRFDFG